MLEESIENITKSNSLFATTFVNHYILPDLNFDEHCLININISIRNKLINIYISCILNQWPSDLNTDFTLSNCIFVCVKLNQNADRDKYVYIGYGIGFDLRLEFSLPDGSMGKSFIIFGVDMTSSVHNDNKGKDILILGEGPTQRLDDTTLTI